MSQWAGAWVAGDTGTPLEYEVTQDGAAFNVTGATDVVLTLIRVNDGVETVITITGAVQTPGTAGVFEWTGANAIGANVASPGSRRRPDVYEARVRFVLSGAAYWTEPFRITVEKGPTDYTPTTTPPTTASAVEGQSLQPIVDAMTNGGLLYLTGGSFYADIASPSTPLTIPSTKPIIIRGVHTEKTFIKSPILIEAFRCGLEDLTVRSAAGAAYGVKIFRSGAFVARCWMNRVVIGATYEGAGDGPVRGIILDGAGVFLAHRVTSAFCTSDGMLVDSTSVEPNTTLKFDMCSFVGNGGYGADLAASCSIAEFNGGNMEGNALGELRANAMNNLRLIGVDFEPQDVYTNAVEATNCNPVEIIGCSFGKISGATRAIFLQGGSGHIVEGNRFNGWGTVGVVRISEGATNARVGVNVIADGSGWIEDYSR